MFQKRLTRFPGLGTGAFLGLLLGFVWVNDSAVSGSSVSARFEILHSALDGGGGSSSAGLYSVESSIEGFGGLSLGSSGGISLAQGEAGLLNEPPFPGKDFIELPLNGSLNLSAAELLANDFDQEGNILVLSIERTNTTQGGTVRLLNGTILYTPPNGLNMGDSFFYTVADAYGGTAVGTAVLFSKVSAPQLFDFRINEKNIVMLFRGTPGTFYLLQFRADLGAKTFWRDYPDENEPLTLQADQTGNFQFTAPIGSGQGFFRTVGAESLRKEIAISRTGSQIAMTFRGRPHSVYKLQFRQSLDRSDLWHDHPNPAQPLTIQTANDGTCSLAAPATAGNGFFRLVLRDQ